MSCTLATLIACFSWSGLYVDAGVTAQESGVQRVSTERTLILLSRGPLLGGSFIVGSDETETMVSRGADNPYGRIALGYELEFSPSMKASLEVSRVQSAMGDAVNGVSLNVRWYPFARRQ